jgi:hypothetical protein
MDEWMNSELGYSGGTRKFQLGQNFDPVPLDKL